MYDGYRLVKLDEVTRRDFLRLVGRSGWVVVGVAGGFALLACSPRQPAQGPAPGPETGEDPRIAALKGVGTAAIADPGGPFREAFGKAFHEPFRRLTGINTHQIPREHEPIAAVKAMVEANRAIWDATILTQQAREALTKEALLEPLHWDTLPFSRGELMPEATAHDWMGTDVFAVILAYRTDKFSGANVPRSWADFFDVNRFPGRRAMRRSPIDTLEEALMADGVPPDRLYPLDIDRALRKLDQIKPHITVWWTGGAQTTQLLQSGEVDLVPTWNGRAQAAIDTGAPVGITWDQGLYAIEGFGIPRGAPNRENAQKFICFCSWAENQAAYTPYLTYGPTNLKAYDHIPRERYVFLPTAPDNLGRLTLTDFNWWAANLRTAQEKFDAWLIS